jgi:3-hydroxyisobutyrate dehydrogenase-like beta-hydroxyacid dehydrogenase
MRVGFIGTGRMGRPMARRLLEAGHVVAVHDLHAEASASLLATGARWADSPCAVAQDSEVVFTCLPGPPEVEAVMLDPRDGILAGLPRGAGYVDTSTSAPALAREIARRCHERDVQALDAPVSGGPQGAEQGTLAIMVGGTREAFSQYEPLLQCLGAAVFHLGEAGTGMAAKLVVQHLVYANLTATAEALLLGAKAGLDLGALVQVVSKSGGDSRVLEFFPRLVFPRRFEGLIPLKVALKDVDLVRALAREVQAPSPILDVVQDVMRRGEARGWSDEGFLIALQVLEEAAGAQLRLPR